MKFRSLIDYAQIFAGDLGGYNLGLDGDLFIRQESAPRTFSAPRVGTQGKSVGAAGALTDITALSSPQLKIALRGAAALNVTLVPATKTTGTLVAAELERAINAALATAGSDERVWVLFDSGDDHYEIYDQRTGTASTVVITAGTANNCADDLMLGVANGGTETAGTNDSDALLYTTGGPKYSQPIESNTHRNGRFHGGIVKKKKVAEWEMETFVNMSGSAGDSIDGAVSLLWQATLGKMIVAAGDHIEFKQDTPNVFFSIVRCSTIFGEYYTGAYAKGATVTFPGDGPATVKYSGKASKASRAGIGRAASAVSASANWPWEAGQAKKYTAGAHVMVVDVDGRTILAGADGTLTVVSRDKAADTGVLSAAVTAPIHAYLVPWNPGAVQRTVRDNIYTDLEGSIKLRSTSPALSSVTNIEVDFQNDHVDLDNRFGSDANKGFVAGNRMSAKMSVTFDLSNETLGDVVDAESFDGYDPTVILGNDASGRYLEITAKRWIPESPTIDVPETGTTPCTLTGMLYESAPGAKDPFSVKFK